MSKTALIAFGLLLCLSFSLAQDINDLDRVLGEDEGGEVVEDLPDICGFPCVVDIYNTYCGNSTCVASTQTMKQLKGLCSPKCFNAIEGDILFSCLNSTDPIRNDYNVIQEQFLLSITEICQDNAMISEDAVESEEAVYSYTAVYSYEAVYSYIAVYSGEAMPSSEAAVTCSEAIASENSYYFEEEDMEESTARALDSILKTDDYDY